MPSERLKVCCAGAIIGSIILGIVGFILGAILGGAEQLEGKAITWLIGGVLGAIVCAIAGAGCGVILMLQGYAAMSAIGPSKDKSSKSPSVDENSDPSTKG
jgi:hypothetical protein